MAGQCSPRVALGNTDPVTFPLRGTDAFKASILFFDAAGAEIVATALAQGTREVVASSTVRCRDASVDPPVVLSVIRQENPSTVVLDAFDWKAITTINSVDSVTIQATGNSVVNPVGASTYSFVITALGD